MSLRGSRSRRLEEAVPTGAIAALIIIPIVLAMLALAFCLKSRKSKAKENENENDEGAETSYKSKSKSQYSTPTKKEQPSKADTQRLSSMDRFKNPTLSFTKGKSTTKLHTPTGSINTGTDFMKPVIKIPTPSRASITSEQSRSPSPQLPTSTRSSIHAYKDYEVDTHEPTERPSMLSIDFMDRISLSISPTHKSQSPRNSKPYSQAGQTPLPPLTPTAPRPTPTPAPTQKPYTQGGPLPPPPPPRSVGKKEVPVVRPSPLLPPTPTSKRASDLSPRSLMSRAEREEKFFKDRNDSESADKAYQDFEESKLSQDEKKKLSDERLSFKQHESKQMEHMARMANSTYGGQKIISGGGRGRGAGRGGSRTSTPVAAAGFVKM